MNMTKMKAPTQRKARFDAGQVANRIVKELEPVIGSEIRMYAHYNWVFFHTGLNIYIPGEGIKVVIKPGMETAGQVLQDVMRQLGEAYKQEGIREHQAKLRDLLGAPSSEELSEYSRVGHGHSSLTDEC
jgi:hypothetical protein